MKNLLLIILLCISSICNAKYVQTCNVKYETQEGWSHYYTVDVYFLTGMELNQATGGISYSMYSVYATVFWGENKATVIRITNITACGYETDQNCITSVYDLKGKDQEGRWWKICTTDYCVIK